jgi:4-hydroxyacetophenone monooxygenase
MLVRIGLDRRSIDMNHQTIPVASRAHIAAALAAADVPVLLMVLHHLTGDHRWLDAPYRPVREISIFADESGGLPPAVQDEVRAAALDILEALQAGRLTPPPLPDRATFQKMMSVCVGELIPAEYVPMMLEEMGLEARAPTWPAPPPAASIAQFEVLIIGAGVSGICAAAQFREAGIRYTVLEKNATLGGTWHDNKYPEVGCDVPNHFYSFSFRPNADWSGYYSKGDEIEAYLCRCAEEFGILDRVRFNTEVLSARYDERTARWQVTVRQPDGELATLSANVLVSATGQLNRPKMPTIEGLADFEGPLFHTARWRSDVPLDGRRVAVIGTGASAMQLARSVAARAQSLTIYQRSPQWAVPSGDYHRQVSDGKKWLLRHVPFYMGWYRFTLAWRFSDQLLRTLERDPAWPHPERAVNARNDRHRERLTEYLLDALGERSDLVAKCLPDYPPYGKRILIDNDWFKTLKRDNVELVTDDIARLTAQGVETADGVTREADVVILATGFEATRLLWPVEFTGRDGESLRSRWGDDDASAYLGLTVPGFPNLFCLYGPNTNLGHGGSIIMIAECQVRYVLGCVMKMITDGVQAIECREEVCADYVARLDAEHAKLVWTSPGLDNWYRNKAGRVVSVMPWRLVDYWRYTLAPDFDDYHVRRYA